MIQWWNGTSDEEGSGSKGRQHQDEGEGTTHDSDDGGFDNAGGSDGAWEGVQTRLPSMIRWWWGSHACSNDGEEFSVERRMLLLIFYVIEQFQQVPMLIQ